MTELAHAPRAQRHWTLARWPTWFALAFAALNLAGLEDGGELAAILVISAFAYLTTAALDRPRAAWPVVAALTAGFAVTKLLDGPWPPIAVTVAVLAVVAAGLAGGPLRRPGPYALQIPAFALFAMVALGGLTVTPYLVAAGLIAHAGWDVHHWRADVVVTRSLAEWCGVLDLTLGLGILAITLT